MRILGTHISNSLQEHMKAETNFIKFREYITSGSNQFANVICVSISTNKYVNHMITTSDLFTENAFAFFVFSFSVKYGNIVFIYHKCN